MAEIRGAGKQKPTLFSRLPKLGRVSQLVLLIGVFLIIIIPLILIQNQQRLEQTEYEQQIALLQRILSTPYTQAATLEDELRQAETSLSIIKNKFPTQYYAKEALNDLFRIARSNGVAIVKASTSIGELTLTEGSVKTTYPSLMCDLGIAGDSAKFQNFLVGIRELETCRINSITINMAVDVKEEDSAMLDLQILLQR
jgi:Tfp pilus assembly protein PilO